MTRHRVPTPLCAPILALLVAAACGDADEPSAGLPPVTQVKLQPEAQCIANVVGIGEVDLEDDYLPHVVQCENGGANLEALEAQAIAARSVVYHAMASGGSICDGQGCQVYSCGAEPTELQRQAVRNTAGQILAYNGQVTYGFFVSGDSNTSAPDCMGSPSVGIEKWVTYNEGAVGDDVEQTKLGWKFSPGEAGYGQNRGCMSQWGARCLEDALGYDARQILQTYYGADIEIVQTTGTCVGAEPEPQPEPEPEPEPQPGAPCDAVLEPNTALSPGESVSSCNGRYTLWMQEDGNVVLYENATGEPLWNTDTVGTRDPVVVMQDDGNFVLYDGSGVAVWNTVTYGHPGAALRVEEDGNVIVWDGWTRIWSAR